MTEQNGKTIKISPAILSIIILLALQIVVIAFGYGQLSSQVTFNRELIKAYQANQNSIITKLDEQTSRITKLEVQVENLAKQIK